MFKKLHYKVRGLPTPLAGLALGIASLGWCLENALPLAGWGQTTGAVIGLVMIGFLVLRFTAHHDTLWADLKHPVVGSIVPTFAMCLMVVSKTAGHWMPEAGVVLWCAAVLLHLAALGIFVVNRLQEPCRRFRRPDRQHERRRPTRNASRPWSGCQSRPC